MLNCSCHTSTSGWRSSLILCSNSEPFDNKACSRSKMSRFNLLRFCCSLLTSGKALELFVFKCNTKACNNACHFCRGPEFLCASGAGFPQSNPIWVPQAAWCIFTIFSLDSYFVHILLVTTQSSHKRTITDEEHTFKLYIQQKLCSWSFLLSVWWGKVCVSQSPKRILTTAWSGATLIIKSGLTIPFLRTLNC
jgi:hypothetical protein